MGTEKGEVARTPGAEASRNDAACAGVNAETMFDSPDHTPPAPDGVAVEAAIRRAIDARRRDLVDVVGAGELTIALRWTSGGRPCVVKRMPPYPDMSSAERYMAVVRQHIADLEARGVRCVSNTMQAVTRADGSVVVIHCQPLLDVDSLADNVLRSRTPDAEDPLVTTLVDRIVAVVADGIPIDPQFANWCWFDGDLWQLDLSTPFIVDNGDIVYDTSGFQHEFPWLIRRTVYRELMKAAVKGSVDGQAALTFLRGLLLLPQLRVRAPRRGEQRGDRGDAERELRPPRRCVSEAHQASSSLRAPRSSGGLLASSSLAEPSSSAGTRYAPSSQRPRSTSLHDGEQKGKAGFFGVPSRGLTSRAQIGQTCRAREPMPAT